MQTSRKFKNIQGLRGLAVLMVVFEHMNTIEKKYSQSDYILPVFFEIGGFGIDLFFLISGFIMVAVTRGSFRSKVGIQKFIYHRITRIYPLYWVYTFIVLFVWLIFPHMVNNSQGNQVNIFASILLAPQSLSPLVMQGWTLIHEVYFYLIFSIFLFFPKNKFLFGLFVWAVIVFIGNFLSYNNPFSSVYFSPLTFEFIAGCLIGKLYFSRELKGDPTLIALMALIFWLVSYFLYGIEGGWSRVFIFGAPASLALYSALLYEKRYTIVAPKWLCKIGDASYSIYLSHILVLSAVGVIWRLSSADEYLNNMVMLLIMFVSVIFVGYFSFRFIERPVLKITQLVEKKYLASPLKTDIANDS